MSVRTSMRRFAFTSKTHVLLYLIWTGRINITVRILHSSNYGLDQFHSDPSCFVTETKQQTRQSPSRFPRRISPSCPSPELHVLQVLASLNVKQQTHPTRFLHVSRLDRANDVKPTRGVCPHVAGDGPDVGGSRGDPLVSPVATG